MIEAFKGEEIIRKTGGRFRLTALVQRRLKELIDGARPLVPSEGKTLLEVVVDEIMQDKISIDYERSPGLAPPDEAMLTQKFHGSEDSQEY
jgi:DNA-directed RNA polymerase subunit omega